MSDVVNTSVNDQVKYVLAKPPYLYTILGIGPKDVILSTDDGSGPMLFDSAQEAEVYFETRHSTDVDSGIVEQLTLKELGIYARPITDEDYRNFEIQKSAESE